MNNVVDPRRMTSSVINRNMGFPFGVDRPRDIAPFISRRRCWNRNNSSRENEGERKNRKFVKSLRHHQRFSERCSWLQPKKASRLDNLSDQNVGPAAGVSAIVGRALRLPSEI